MTETRTADQDALLERIRQHLATLSHTSQFTARLARENNWSPAFAQAVVEEYAKFLFIAREGGHPVSPSPMIDKAWHLHLLYTKEYWSDFCPNILGFNLDHSPHTGDPSENAKFDEWTTLTLSSYRKFFGTPNRIWLPARYLNAAYNKVMAVIVIFLGMVILGAVGMFQPGAVFYLFALLIIGVGIFIFVNSFRPSLTGVSSDSTAGGCGTFSGCGSSDSSSYTGPGGSGGHGHSCGGGHGGGHGCGGHGCGGGGH